MFNNYAKDIIFLGALGIGAYLLGAHLLSGTQPTPTYSKVKSAALGIRG